MAIIRWKKQVSFVWPSNAHSVNIWDLNLVITIAADGLPPLGGIQQGYEINFALFLKYSFLLKIMQLTVLQLNAKY